MASEKERQDANDFLMGGSIPGISFPEIGTHVEGTIVDYRKVQQKGPEGELRTWDDGSPQFQLVVTLATDLREDEMDDGKRNLYVKSNMLTALREAIKASKFDGDMVGSKLYVRYVSDGEKKKRGFNAPKLYEVKFTPRTPF